MYPSSLYRSFRADCMASLFAKRAPTPRTIAGSPVALYQEKSDFNKIDCIYRLMLNKIFFIVSKSC